MEINDLKPGRVIEFDGDLFLLETVRVQLTLQRIESAADQIDEVFRTGLTEPMHPVFMRLEGELDDPSFSPERFKPLYKEDEL